MSGRATLVVTAAAWLALAGCGRDDAPAPEPVQSAVSAATPSAAPEPKPEASPVPERSEAAVVAVGKVYAPGDDCSAKPGWPAFHTALVGAIKARDATALAALAAPDIALDYGGGSGIAELKKRLDDPTAQLWHELDAILPLGCAIEGGLAAMPWVFWNVPDDIDSYNAMLVTGADVSLRDGPKPTAKALAQVGWNIVGTDPMEFQPDKPTTKITMQDGRKGWIATSRLRSLLDYRVIAEPKDDGWQITAFIAGD